MTVTVVEVEQFSTLRPAHGHQHIGGCDMIHLVFIVNGCNDLSTAVKSILFNRTSPLHLHLIVNKTAQPIVDTLFRTWQLPMLNYTLYYNTLQHGTSLVMWLPSLLPSTIDSAIIVLDTKMVVLGDIHHLWLHHLQMTNTGKILGMVQSQEHSQELAVNIILMNLKWFRERQSIQTSTSLSYMIENNLVYKLPCEWDININNNQHCYHKDNKYMTLHWNKPCDDTNYFNSTIIINKFKRMDGSQMRYNNFLCHNKTYTKKYVTITRRNICDFYREEVHRIYRTHTYFHGSCYVSTDKWDVTLLVQFSVDRLNHLDKVLEHWDGPMSVAIYASDEEAWQVNGYLEKVLKDRTNVGVHMVFKDGTLYPVNYMRNVALERVQTPFVFLSDFDFVPMKSLYSYLKSAVTTMSGNRQAFIVPAYESRKYDINFPTNKDDLVKMVQQKELRPFHLNLYAVAHAPTGFPRWESTDEEYDVEWAPEFEPYIVVRSDVVQYDERFVGYGWNKVSHIYELDKQGYRFTVLPQGFIVHLPHPYSTDYKSVWSVIEFRHCIEQSKKEFKKDLQEKYGA